MKVDYVRSLDPPAPFLPITVAHPMRPNAVQSALAQVDTGSDITAIPASQVQALNLSERHLLRVVGYDNQPATIPTYDAMIEIAHLRLRLQVVAISADDALIGRDALNLLRLLLDGPALTLEILAPQLAA